jgi:hypothetical protein
MKTHGGSESCSEAAGEYRVKGLVLYTAFT